MKSLLLIPAAISTLALCGQAFAATVASTSFEAPTFPALGAGQDKYGPDASGFNNPASGPLVVPGFTFSGYSGIFSNPPLCCAPATPFGDQFGFVQAYQNTGGAISWTVNGLSPLHSYQLMFNAVGGSNQVGVDPIAVNFTGATGTSANTFTPATTGWVGDAVSFVANQGSVTITFQGSSNPGNLLTGIDNLRVTSAVPEPASWALMLVGFGGLGAALRMSRRRQVAFARI